MDPSMTTGQPGKLFRPSPLLPSEAPLSSEALTVPFFGGLYVFLLPPKHFITFICFHIQLSDNSRGGAESQSSLQSNVYCLFKTF